MIYIKANRLIFLVLFVVLIYIISVIIKYISVKEKLRIAKVEAGRTRGRERSSWKHKINSYRRYIFIPFMWE